MVASFTTTSIDATVFRYSSYDSPFWVRNNTTSGRWHVAGDGATQYLALHPDGAWAELARAEGLRTEDDLAEVRIPIWAITLSQGNLVNYSTFELADAAGFDPDALVDDDYTRTQVEGQRLRLAGYGGIIAPSAALPGTVNVTLFGRRVRTSWGLAARLASSLPATIVARGGPPAGLASRVRYFGEEHSGLAAYVAGTSSPAGGT